MKDMPIRRPALRRPGRDRAAECGASAETAALSCDELRGRDRAAGVLRTRRLPNGCVAALVLTALALGGRGAAWAADLPSGPPASPPEARAEYLYGLPAGVDLERLVDKPLLVGSVNYLFVDPGTEERRLGGYAEVIAVYDVPLAALVAAATDFERYPVFVPRIHGTRIMRRSGGDYRLLYNAGVKFLGIDVTYDTVVDTVTEYLPGGAFGMRSWLVESLDGNLFEGYTSLYFCPVSARGKTMTFVRYFNRPGIRRPSAGLLQILNLFTPPESRGQVSAIAKEAGRRAGTRP